MPIGGGLVGGDVVIPLDRRFDALAIGLVLMAAALYLVFF